MAGTKEIKEHISAVRETKKITNAMYLISSTKLRRARDELNRTRPYFDALRTEIMRIFCADSKVKSRYFFAPDGSVPEGGVCGVLVITADKGLAGAYNVNVLRQAEALLREKPNARLFVVGEYGRRYFHQHRIPIEASFLYTAQSPTLHRAREICTLLLDLYDRCELDEVFVLYTDMKNSLSSSALSSRLLPLEIHPAPSAHGLHHKAHHKQEEERNQRQQPVEVQHHSHRGDKRNGVGDDVGKAVVDQLADRVNVVGKPAHQIAGLVGVEVLQRHGLQFGE